MSPLPKPPLPLLEDGGAVSSPQPEVKLEGETVFGFILRTLSKV